MKNRLCQIGKGGFLSFTQQLQQLVVVQTGEIPPGFHMLQHPRIFLPLRPQPDKAAGQRGD